MDSIVNLPLLNEYYMTYLDDLSVLYHIQYMVILFYKSTCFV